MPLLTTIVPAKRCSLAKQRLSAALNADERSMLATVMFHDVMVALSELRPKSHVLVVTADNELGSIARGYDAEVMLDRWEDGVTRAVREATMAMSDRGFDAAMIIPADVPLVQPGELKELLQTHAERGITIVPADSDQGTNAIIASPPTAIAFDYGPNSLYRHLDLVRQAGLTARVMQVAGLNLDVDRPSDLVRVLASDRLTRTKAYLLTLNQDHLNPCLASATPPTAWVDCTAAQRDGGASK
jgi:2-phospho-L-lactate guanylyltransferase